MKKLLVAAVLALATAGTLGPLSSAATAPRPLNGGVQAFDAPIGGKGAVDPSGAYCSNYRVEPRTRVVIESLATGRTWTYHWTGALPGMAVTRVEVGSYEVRTRGTCRGTTRRWVETVRVKEKTAQTTVSIAEWRRIKRGMTPQRVARIVGYHGDSAGRFAGQVARRYHMMRFWRWSIVYYRNGHVVSKAWNVGHD
jgi:hypothetical protein